MSRVVVPLFRWLGITRDLGSWLDPSVVACAYPKSDAAMSALAAQGVSLIVNLHSRPHPGDQLTRRGLIEVHLPTPDFAPPAPVDLMRGVEMIERAREGGRKVAVHCGAGLGRTGTLLACYLVKRGLGADEAISRVRQVRPGSVETAAQETAVRNYATSLAEPTKPHSTPAEPE